MTDPTFASAERYRTAWQVHGVAALAAAPAVTRDPSL